MYGGYRTDRRRYQRLRVSLCVLCKIMAPEHIRALFSERKFEASTIDISEGGASLEISHYLPLKTMLSIEFIVFEVNHKARVSFYNPLTLQGEISSLNVLGDDTYRMGITFKEVNTFKRQKLQDLMYSPLKYLEESYHNCFTS